MGLSLRGIIRGATLDEVPPGSGNIEMRLELQGVGPGQPRWIVVPYRLLLLDEGLDPEAVCGRSFAAEVEEDGPRRWVVAEITIAGRLLRPPD